MPAVGRLIKSLELTFDPEGVTPQVVDCAVNSAHFVPGGRARQTRGTGCGQAVDYGLPEDTLEVGYNVDPAAGSFHRYLSEHEGEEVGVKLVHQPSGVAESASVRLTPGTPTGAIGEWHTGTVSLGVIGVVTWEDPVAP